MQNPITVRYADIESAAECLAGRANRTPVVTSRTVNARLNASVFFKCEHLQRTGAFKFRGAFNASTRLSEAQKEHGILAYSSGNHAQAVALSGQLLGLQTTIIMPRDAPAVKLAATTSYGAEVVPYDRAETTREALARTIAEERGLTLIPPYDHPHVIAGQGTATKELIEETGPLDLLVVCCGGGGLLSGSVLSAKALSPACRVVGVEPEAADDACRSFRTKTLQTVHNPDTIADGARTPYLGQHTFPIVMRYVDDMVSVSDAALVRTMHFFWERLKLVVEPTGVLAAAALLEGVVQAEGLRVGVILSGGNVDLNYANRLFADYL